MRAPFGQLPKDPNMLPRTVHNDYETYQRHLRERAQRAARGDGSVEAEAAQLARQRAAKLRRENEQLRRENAELRRGVVAEVAR